MYQSHVARLKNEVQCRMHMLICCRGAWVSTFPDSFYVRQFSSSRYLLIGSKTVIMTCVIVCVCMRKLTERFQYKGQTLTFQVPILMTLGVGCGWAKNFQSVSWLVGIGSYGGCYLSRFGDRLGAGIGERAYYYIVYHGSWRGLRVLWGCRHGGGYESGRFHIMGSRFFGTLRRGLANEPPYGVKETLTRFNFQVHASTLS